MPHKPQARWQTRTRSPGHNKTARLTQANLLLERLDLLLGLFDGLLVARGLGLGELLHGLGELLRRRGDLLRCLLQLLRLLRLHSNAYPSLADPTREMHGVYC